MDATKELDNSGPKGWQQALTSLAYELNEIEEALINGRDLAELSKESLFNFGNLGPIPDALLDEARELAAKSRFLEKQLQEAADVVARELASTQRVHRHEEEKSPPSFVDETV